MTDTRRSLDRFRAGTWYRWYNFWSRRRMQYGPYVTEAWWNLDHVPEGSPLAPAPTGA